MIALFNGVYNFSLNSEVSDLRRLQARGANFLDHPVYSVSIFKKPSWIKLLFHVKRPLDPERRKGDRPAGRRLKIASTVDWQRGGWCCTLSCALACTVLSKRDRRVKVEGNEVIHLCHRSGRSFLFGWQSARADQCYNEGMAE